MRNARHTYEANPRVHDNGQKQKEEERNERRSFCCMRHAYMPELIRRHRCRRRRSRIIDMTKSRAHILKMGMDSRLFDRITLCFYFIFSSADAIM